MALNHKIDVLPLPLGWAIATAVILVLLNGFFVAAEFAIVKLRRFQAQELAQRSPRIGKKLLYIIDNLDYYLSATQLGITLTSLALGWIGEPAFAIVISKILRFFNVELTEQILHMISLATAFAIITFAHIVIGELAPKSLAIRKTKETSMFVTIPLLVFSFVVAPFIAALNGVANILLKIVGIEDTLDKQQVSLGELKLAIYNLANEKQFDETEMMLYKVLEFKDRTAKNVMVPKNEVVFLSLEKPLEENLKIARDSGHTRLPLCKGGLDNVIGTIHIKDLFRVGKIPEDLSKLARNKLEVPETIRLDELLKKMRKEKIHLAYVYDEFGNIIGIVTLENVIEAIVGSIEDEFDEEMPFIENKGKFIRADAKATFGDVARILGETNIEEDIENETLAWVILDRLGRTPKVGEKVEIGNLVFTVEEVTGRTIKKVSVTRKEDKTKH